MAQAHPIVDATPVERNLESSGDDSIDEDEVEDLGVTEYEQTVDDTQLVEDAPYPSDRSDSDMHDISPKEARMIETSNQGQTPLAKNKKVCFSNPF